MINEEIKHDNRVYFAGLFDGEGTVGISKSKNSAGNYSYALHVSFGLTYKPVLLRMQKYFSGRIGKTNMEKLKNRKSVQKAAAASCISPENWKQKYDYDLSGRNALYFLKVIEPFCDEKKSQVTLAIKFQEGRRPNAGGGGRSNRESERCEFFYQELRKAKHELPLAETKIKTGFEDDQLDLFDFGG